MERLLRRLKALPHEQRRNSLDYKPRPVLGADRRKVAPDLAPALQAVAVSDPHEDGRTVEFVQSVYRGDRYRIVSELSRREP